MDRPELHTSESDYIFGKYVYPFVFPLGTLALSVGCIVLDYLYKDPVALATAAAMSLICVTCCYYLIPQLRRLKKVDIFKEGISYENTFRNWNEIVDIRQIFIFRIEFECEQAGKSEIIAMPIPFSLENFTYPVKSELLQKLQDLKNEAR